MGTGKYTLQMGGFCLRIQEMEQKGEHKGEQEGEQEIYWK